VSRHVERAGVGHEPGGDGRHSSRSALPEGMSKAVTGRVTTVASRRRCRGVPPRGGRPRGPSTGPWCVPGDSCPRRRHRRGSRGRQRTSGCRRAGGNRLWGLPRASRQRPIKTTINQRVTTINPGGCAPMRSKHSVITTFE
jgi:hypothetical protein